MVTIYPNNFYLQFYTRAKTHNILCMYWYAKLIQFYLLLYTYMGFQFFTFFSYSSDLMNCDFESSSWQTDSGCGLVQSYSDDFQWSWRSGSTPSSSTGPSSASKGSYYLYIETSSTSLNARAVLMSSYLNTSNTIYFLIRNQF